MTDFRSITISDLLDRRAATTADRFCFAHHTRNEQYTYGEFKQLNDPQRAPTELAREWEKSYCFPGRPTEVVGNMPTGGGRPIHMRGDESREIREGPLRR